MSDKKIINLRDSYSTLDNSTILKHISEKGVPKKTRITITNPITKEVYGVYENKVVISGAMYTACSLFGLDMPTTIPNYNSELQLDRSEAPGTAHTDPQLVTLFCVGDSGCGSVESDIKVVNFIDRIAPTNDIIPFRYCDDDADIQPEERKVYFGRKTDTTAHKISYYFKKFETEPQLFMKYSDGTEITNQLYNFTTTQDADCYIEMELLISADDLKDYFNEVTGWGNARISTISLCSAWYKTIGGYKYYQNILPYTKLNFPFIRMVETEQAVQFNYAIFY